MSGVFITGLGHFLPPRLIRNEDLAPGVAPDPAGITKRTGIQSRHYAPVGMNTSDMAIEASRGALASARLAPEDIDCIVAATLSPNYAFPGIGVYVQHQLGFGQIPAYDIRNQCSGFLYALNVARAFLVAGFHKKILLTCAELQSHALGQTEMHAHITPLFGDGAGTVVVCDEAAPHGGGFSVDYVRVHADGSGADRLRQRVWDTAQDPFLDWKGVAKSQEEFVHCEMDGQFIFRKAVGGMADAARAALKAEGLTIDDIDWVVPHQANLNINKTVGSVLKLPPEKLLSNIQRVGNTTAASIPILLSESVAAGTIKPGHRVLSLAFGSGLTWGAALLRAL
ncbi:MAG TPA: ketoacyl-ACP synthase III [Kofleriaceae bacterium]|nr:ketoacyl-ACP synthase III [Kofleriaceae bacterium]